MSFSETIDLDITIISAKHLKNVNWRNGDLKPYTTFNLDSSDPRLATHADDSGSTRPVWNERFTLTLTRPVSDSVLNIEIYHSKPSQTPKPLVGTVKFPLVRLDWEDSPLRSPNSIYNLEVIRPSGRPQGKVRVRLELKDRLLPPLSPDYRSAPSYSHYYSPAPPPPPPPPSHPREYREFPPSPYAHTDQYSYHSGYYYPPQPPLPPRPLFNRPSSIYGLPSLPSAPVGSSSPYDHKPVPVPPLPTSLPKGLNVPSYGGPSGPSAPVDYSYAKSSGSELNGAMGGLSLEESSGYQKERSSTADRESLSYLNYRREY